MKKVGIYLKNVNLAYSSVAYQERSLKNLLANAFRIQRSKGIKIEDVAALRDINLHVEAGERVGLLGHNGAGKSTFLKMVAGLYPISSGERNVSGDVRSLFDLSLGFEPDATGKENILYRGLLLGLTPKQVKEKEEEIIQFADLGKFIHYPIKTYSAGMLVRLAFAISTATEGEILLLDEVIGAGDANFMIKAQKRIRELIDSSTLMILASHDFNALREICTRGIVFQQGRIVYDGAISDAINEYEKISIKACCVGAKI